MGSLGFPVNPEMQFHYKYEFFVWMKKNVDPDQPAYEAKIVSCFTEWLLEQDKRERFYDILHNV